MNMTPEQLQATAKANVEAILGQAAAQFTAFEKFANLSASAVKAAFEDMIVNTRALAGAKDTQELVNLQSTFAQPAIDKATAYSKSLYEMLTQANTEFTKANERRIAEWNESFVSLLNNAAKNAPAGSDVAVNAVKQVLTAANSAYDSFNKVAKQATEIAEANVAAASEAVKGLSKLKKAA